MAPFTTDTQTIHSFASSFQSGWRPTDSSSIHTSLNFHDAPASGRHLLDCSIFALGDTEVRPADTTATFGVHCDSCMTMTVHVN